MEKVNPSDFYGKLIVFGILDNAPYVLLQENSKIPSIKFNNNSIKEIESLFESIMHYSSSFSRIKLYSVENIQNKWFAYYYCYVPADTLTNLNYNWVNFFKLDWKEKDGATLIDRVDYEQIVKMGAK